MSDTAEPFPFMKLPPEIREMIWRLCVPARIFEVGETGEWGEKGVRCLFEPTTKLNRKMPALGYICRESRAICLKMGEWTPGSCWFTPTRDIAFMHWIPEYSSIIWGSDVDLNPDHFQYHGRCQGMGIVANRIQDFWPPPPRLKENWVNEDLDVLARTEKDWLISMLVVVIHTTAEAGRKSGLFGLLGDAPIQLVEATDTETITKYRDLWASSYLRTPEPAEFFENQQGFQRRLQEWFTEVETIWVFNQWWECSPDFQGVANPEDIWLGPRLKPDGEPIDKLKWWDLCRQEDVTHCNLDMERFSLNRDHPFVQKSRAAMPRFHPRVMFRLCPGPCPTYPNFHTTMGTWDTGGSDESEVSEEPYEPEDWEISDDNEE